MHLGWHYKIKQQLGLKEWPDEGMVGKIYHEKQAVWLILQVRPKNNGSRKHRAFAQCPICAKWIPTGRMAQHFKIHE